MPENITSPRHQISASDTGPDEQATGQNQEIAGTEIVQPCDDAVPGSTDLTELVVVLTADASGAHIKELAIDYVTDQRPYTRIIRREMILCGKMI